MIFGLAVLPFPVWADSDEDARFLKENLDWEAPNAREMADEIARQFGTEDSPTMREKIAVALLQYIRDLGQHGSAQVGRMSIVKPIMDGGWPKGSDIAFYNEIIRRFDNVKFRLFINRFNKQIRMLCIPRFEGIDRGLVANGPLRDEVIVSL
jgi:hypothetical protein